MRTGKRRLPLDDVFVNDLQPLLLLLPQPVRTEQHKHTRDSEHWSHSESLFSTTCLSYSGLSSMTGQQRREPGAVTLPGGLPSHNPSTQKGH